MVEGGADQERKEIFTGSFVLILSLQLIVILSTGGCDAEPPMRRDGCAHRARNRSLVRRFALDIEGDTIGGLGFDLEDGCSDVF